MREDAFTYKCSEIKWDKKKAHNHTLNWQIVPDIYSFSAQKITPASDETAELSSISHHGNVSIISR